MRFAEVPGCECVAVHVTVIRRIYATIFALWGNIMANRDNNCDRIHKSISEDNFRRLLDLIEDVQFGTITLVIQDRKVVQIDKNEKIRLV